MTHLGVRFFRMDHSGGKQIGFLLFILSVFLLTFSACSAQHAIGALYNLEVIEQPESPLIPGSNLALLENRWRLTELTYQGSPVEFDAIAPIFISFHPAGGLLLRTTGCGDEAFLIFASSQTEYLLILAPSALIGCDGPQNSQAARVSMLIFSTNKYTELDNKLILSGDGVQAVFVVDNEAKEPSD